MSDANVLTIFPTDPTSPRGETPLTIELGSESLSPPQREALGGLMEGQTVTAAAKTAGVDRGTVHRWINANPNFRAAYNAWQHETRESSKAKLLSLSNDALGVVAKAVQDGDRHIAYRLLKDLGLLAKLQPGQTDPDLLLEQLDIEHADLQRAHDARIQHAPLQIRHPAPAIPPTQPESA